MKCNVCKMDINKNDIVCNNCGAKLEDNMIFNKVLAILMILGSVISWLTMWGILTVLFGRFPWLPEAPSIICYLFLSIVRIVSGATLLKRKKIGYVLSKIVNLSYCLISISIAYSGVSLFVAAFGTGEYAMLGYMLGALFLFVSICMFVFNTVSFFYYRKNKNRLIN